MRVTPAIHWTLGALEGASLDARLIELLARIDTEGSLRAACDAARIPYRTAWGMLQDIERTVGGPLVRLERGRGASLTEDGVALIRADEAAKRRFSRDLELLAVNIGSAAARTSGAAASVVRLAASHDPALAALQDALPVAAGIRLEIEFCGSIDALARFRAGEVDLAGFHFVPGDSGMVRRYLRSLRPARDRLLRFVDRQQGLIVAHGNPHRLRCLSDVARRGLRFVNRQSGSGTRMLINAQLEREGLSPDDLSGFATEEFTHAAVAATVAAGRADAGLGVAAAAAEYDLDFVSLVQERYDFAVREADARSATIMALRNSLTGPVFRELVGRMAGYDAGRSGALERVDLLQRWRRRYRDEHQARGKTRNAHREPTG
jgi:molybdate transport repressor ModE-like protein